MPPSRTRADFNCIDIWLVAPTSFAEPATNRHGIANQERTSVQPWALRFNIDWLG